MIRLNGLPINITVFPDNTSQVWKLKSLEDKENNYFHVEWDFSSESELLHLAQLKYLLDYKQVDCSLTIKYLPYARQDKSVNNFSTFALKSTLCVINGDEKQIFKDPKTDNGIKKSQKGRVVVLRDGNSFKFTDSLYLNDSVKGDQLVEIFRDGKLLVDDSFSQIRNRLASYK